MGSFIISEDGVFVFEDLSAFWGPHHIVLGHFSRSGIREGRGFQYEVFVAVVGPQPGNTLSSSHLLHTSYLTTESILAHCFESLGAEVSRILPGRNTAGHEDM